MGASPAAATIDIELHQPLQRDVRLLPARRDAAGGGDAAGGLRSVAGARGGVSGPGPAAAQARGRDGHVLRHRRAARPPAGDGVRAARARGRLACQLTTNGSLLSRATAVALLDAGLEWLTVNVSELGADYERVYGLSFARTRDNVEQFIDLARGRCVVGIVVVDHHRDEAHLRAVEDYSASARRRLRPPLRAHQPCRKPAPRRRRAARVASGRPTGSVVRGSRTLADLPRTHSCTSSSAGTAATTCVRPTGGRRWGSAACSRLPSPPSPRTSSPASEPAADLRALHPRPPEPAAAAPPCHGPTRSRPLDASLQELVENDHCAQAFAEDISRRRRWVRRPPRRPESHGTRVDSGGSAR